MLRCKKCNSKKVEGKFWVNLNTFEIGGECSDETTLCLTCNDEVETYDDDYHSKEILAKELGWTYELWMGSKRLGDDNKDVYYWYNPEGESFTIEEFNNIKKEEL